MRISAWAGVWPGPIGHARRLTSRLLFGRPACAVFQDIRHSCSYNLLMRTVGPVHGCLHDRSRRLRSGKTIMADIDAPHLPTNAARHGRIPERGGHQVRRQGQEHRFYGRARTQLLEGTARLLPGDTRRTHRHAGSSERARRPRHRAARARAGSDNPAGRHQRSSVSATLRYRPSDAWNRYAAPVP